MPTDENLKMRGSIIASICSLCGLAEESTSHLFLTCCFAQSMWNWLSSKLLYSVDFSSMETLFNFSCKGFSSQLNDVVLAAIINLIWVIWFARNDYIFHNKAFNLLSAQNLVSAVVKLSGKLSSGTMHNSIEEFAILKHFKIDGHHCRAPKIKQVIWLHPPCNWTKCNIDGAAHGSPGISGCGVIFKGYHAAALGCFSCHLGCSTSLFAELSAAINAIEIASRRGWLKLWIETDSALGVKAFTQIGYCPLEATVKMEKLHDNS